MKTSVWAQNYQSSSSSDFYHTASFALTANRKYYVSANYASKEG